jgi:2-polyprenyl-6-methoxyphenol hydroxylase-like FAD-dependent oxidoreductase
MQDSDKQPSEEMIMQQEETTCCIVGAGPAGAILALLLARKGVDVTLLEEHMDFARDFRGDTVHPSTMEVLEQLGLAERLLQLEHTKASTLSFKTLQEGTVMSVDFRNLKTHYPYITLIPQARFLEFITQESSRYPHFHLIMGARAEKLIEEEGTVHGVHYRGRDGWHELRAILTVGADGRFSRMRKLAGAEQIKTSAPMDVLWFQLPQAESDAHESGFMVGPGYFLIQLDRGTEWQMGYVIPKGGYQSIKAAGLAQFRQMLAERMPPGFADRIEILTEWKQIAVLSVESSYVERWYKPGLLLIGDAAHVMTPVGGVGINYAIQDAVATANILTDNLKAGKVLTEDLARVQLRRESPTKQIQRFQNIVQKRFLARVLSADKVQAPPLLPRLLLKIPIVRNKQAELIAFGPRPERVENP